MIRSLEVGRFLEWVAIKAEGAFGGILIFWDTRVIQLLEKEEGQYTLSCRFKSLEENFHWVFTGFMVPLCMGGGRISGKSWGLLGGYGEILGA